MVIAGSAFFTCVICFAVQLNSNVLSGAFNETCAELQYAVKKISNTLPLSPEFLMPHLNEYLVYYIVCVYK